MRVIYCVVGTPILRRVSYIMKISIYKICDRKRKYKLYHKLALSWRELIYISKLQVRPAVILPVASISCHAQQASFLLTPFLQYRNYLSSIPHINSTTYLVGVVYLTRFQLLSVLGNVFHLSSFVLCFQ
jgi:hypothetical protein